MTIHSDLKRYERGKMAIENKNRSSEEDASHRLPKSRETT